MAIKASLGLINQNMAKGPRTNAYQSKVQHEYLIRRSKVSRHPGRRELATEVFSRLPREIRNRVYTFCVQGPCDNEVIVRRALGKPESCAFLIRRRTAGGNSYQWIEDPIASLIDTKCLGTDVAREMLEAYYWTRIFKFSQYESFLLESFLTTDKFGLAMLPADYARHLHLRLEPPKYMAPLAQNGPSDFKKCLATVESLTSIPTARLQVVFDLDSSECIEDYTHHDPLNVDVPSARSDVEFVVKAMNAKGLRTRIAYRRGWDE